MKSFLSRTPFALLGAVALFNLASDLIVVHQKIQLWLNAWEAITRPLWEFLFGWLFDLFKLEFPNEIKDYFTVGAISAGMYLRARSWLVANRFDVTLVGNKSTIPQSFPISKALNFFLLWPILVPVLLIFNAIVSGKDNDTISAYGRNNFNAVFLETGVYFFILLALSYAFLYSDPPA